MLALVLSLASGCDEATVSADEPTAESVVVLPDRSVRLSEDAQTFVRIEPAQPAADVSTLRAPARVAYRDGSLAEVGAPTTGRITSVLIRTGQTVAVGAPLFVLRSPDAAAMRAELAAARTRLETALAEARRAADMVDRGVGTERERRAADLHVSEIEIELARARTEVGIVGGGHGGEVTVRAPLAGVVVARRAAVGMTVGPTDASALVEIGDPNALGITADVFDRDAASVRPGASAVVSLPGYADPFHGHVAYVAPTVTSSVRTVPVRIDVDDLPDDARAGLFGRASIALVEHGVVLPTAAVLIRDGSRTVVYTELERGHYASRDVDVQPAGDGLVRVIDGVDEGDRVVVDGALLIDGAADLLL